MPALEAVLVEAEAAGAKTYALVGDYSSFGPWPKETAERLDSLEAFVRIRGNVDRWLREEPEAPAEAQAFLHAALGAARAALGTDLIAHLYELPVRGELDG